MKKVFLSIVFGFLGLTSFAVETVNDFDVALETARKAEKNLLVVFSLESCHYCDVLKRDMDSMNNINNYIVCVLDSRQNKRLTGKMSVKRWPTSIIVSVGKEVYGEASRLVGYGNKLAYDKWLKENAEFFGKGDACGCDCEDDCPCRKNGICTCCGDNCNCCECGCSKDCDCKKDGKCKCKSGKCKCKK